MNMAESMTREKQAVQETGRAAKRAVERVAEGEPTQGMMEAQERVPSSVYAIGAGASILASMILFLTRKKDWSIFVGQWAPTILLMGIFYKLLKPSKEMPQQQ
jgi:hypothetical protein